MNQLDRIIYAIDRRIFRELPEVQTEVVLPDHENGETQFTINIHYRISCSKEYNRSLRVEPNIFGNRTLEDPEVCKMVDYIADTCIKKVRQWFHENSITLVKVYPDAN